MCDYDCLLYTEVPGVLKGGLGSGVGFGSGMGLKLGLGLGLYFTNQ